MYIKEQKAEDTNRKDIIFKRVPVYIEDMDGHIIYPSQDVKKEIKKMLQSICRSE